jgi:pimeloyl-ACP methyl ester carboxylesterase
MGDGSPSAFRERFISAQDGLKLYFRDYGDPWSAATPVLCLPGVTRNSKDFGPLAARLSRHRRVICPDYRGRGRSDYDQDWRNYQPATYVNDIRHLLVACGVHRAHVIGTSLGGILAMAMAVAAPGVVASVVLNDIGPEVGIAGLGGIVAYMRQDRAFPDLQSAADHIRAVFPDLPARSPEDWLTIAGNTYRQQPGRGFVRDWDHAIVNTFGRALDRNMAFWPLFGALRRVPVLAVRGAKSPILSQDTFDKMAAYMPGLTRVVVGDCGHPVALNEQNVLEAIDAHLARA